MTDPLATAIARAHGKRKAVGEVNGIEVSVEKDISLSLRDTQDDPWIITCRADDRVEADNRLTVDAADTRFKRLVERYELTEVDVND